MVFEDSFMYTDELLNMIFGEGFMYTSLGRVEETSF